MLHEEVTIDEPVNTQAGLQDMAEVVDLVLYGRPIFVPS